MKGLLAFLTGFLLGFLAKTFAKSFTDILFTAAAVLAVTGILTNRTELSLLSIPLMLIAKKGG